MEKIILYLSICLILLFVFIPFIQVTITEEVIVEDIFSIIKTEIKISKNGRIEKKSNTKLYIIVKGKGEIEITDKMYNNLEIGDKIKIKQKISLALLICMKTKVDLKK